MVIMVKFIFLLIYWISKKWKLKPFYNSLQSVVLLGGALIVAGVTLASQLITKNMRTKTKKQLLFKILEDELKEKSKLLNLSFSLLIL